MKNNHYTKTYRSYPNTKRKSKIHRENVRTLTSSFFRRLSKFSAINHKTRPPRYLANTKEEKIAKKMEKNAKTETALPTAIDGLFVPHSRFFFLFSAWKIDNDEKQKLST